VSQTSQRRILRRQRCCGYPRTVLSLEQGLMIELFIEFVSEYLDDVWQQASAGQRQVATDTLLTARKGRDRLVYQNRSAAGGLYSVVVLATQRDTSLRLYATTTPHSDGVYPPLPTDSVIRVTAVTSDRIDFAWKPAPRRQTTTATEVRYCVSVSSLRHFRSRCAAHAHRYGDPRPPPPPFAGFGFAGGDRRRRGRKHRRRQTTAAARSKNADKDSVYTCIGTHTNYTYRYGCRYPVIRYPGTRPGIAYRVPGYPSSK